MSLRKEISSKYTRAKIEKHAMENEVWVNKLIRKSNVFRVQEFQGELIYQFTNSYVLSEFTDSFLLNFVMERKKYISYFLI